MIETTYQDCLDLGRNCRQELYAAGGWAGGGMLGRGASVLLLLAKIVTHLPSELLGFVSICGLGFVKAKFVP